MNSILFLYQSVERSENRSFTVRFTYPTDIDKPGFVATFHRKDIKNKYMLWIFYIKINWLYNRNYIKNKYWHWNFK